MPPSPGDAWDLEALADMRERRHVLELVAAWRRGATGWELGPVEAPATGVADAGVALAIAERSGA